LLTGFVQAGNALVGEIKNSYIAHSNLPSCLMQPNSTAGSWASRAVCGTWMLATILIPASAWAQATVSTVAGSGVAGRTDGPAATAQFNTPQGLLEDAQGNLYVADTYSHSIRRVSAAGVVITLAGTGARGYNNSPNLLLAAFALPRGMVLDSVGNLYVVDTGNSSIRRLDAVTGTVMAQGSYCGKFVKAGQL
jgi:secreted PhoX family phosphatase